MYRTTFSLKPDFFKFIKPMIFSKHIQRSPNCSMQHLRTYAELNDNDTSNSNDNSNSNNSSINDSNTNSNTNINSSGPYVYVYVYVYVRSNILGHVYVISITIICCYTYYTYYSNERNMTPERQAAAMAAAAFP